MNIQPSPARTPALETDKSGLFNRVWARWFDSIKSVIDGLRTNVDALPTGVADTSSIDLSIASNVISGVVLPGGVDHAATDNLNSANYTHLTAAQATDLTDGGVTSLHSHADGHDPATVLDTTTVDMSIAGQQISAATIGLTGTITFVE